MPPASCGSSATTAKVWPEGAGNCDWKRETSALNFWAQAESVSSSDIVATSSRELKLSVMSEPPMEVSMLLIGR